MLRFKQYIKESDLGLRIDNPGGDWLKHEKERVESGGRTEHGPFSRIGSVTGSYSKPALIPVSLLSKLKGMQGEQSRVRQRSLDYATDTLNNTGKVTHPPFININHRGEAWVNEGNHRIMAAAKLGVSHLPVEIRYYNGGEDAEGELHPNKVEKYHNDAIKNGVTTENYGEHRDGPVDPMNPSN